MDGPDLSLVVSHSAILVKGALGYFGQQGLPVGIEPIAGLFERCPDTIAMLARMQARLEAARPLQLIDIDGDANAFADRAHVHVFEIDVPGDLVRIVGAAAGKAGHLP